MKTLWGVLAIVATLAYTLAGGSGLGSRHEQKPPPLSIASVERDAPFSLTVTVRNNQTYATRGEVEGSETPLLKPGEEYSTRLDPRKTIRVRESLAYVDEIRFDRSRVTPYDVWQVEERR